MGKSSKVPPPDPRLVEAQLRSMNLQESAITQMLGIAQQQQADSARLMPLQEEQMRFGLDANRTAYDQSQQDRQWLLGRRDALSGLQDQMVGEANAFNSDAETTKRIGIAQADVGKSLADIEAAQNRNLASMGVAPGSGRFASRNNADAARLMAGAANAARADVRQEGRMLTDRATNALAGYPAAAMGATGQGAAMGASGLGIANQGAGGIYSGYGAMTGQQQAAAGVAGSMGSNASSMWGQQANYKLQSDQAAGSDLGGVGALMGGAAKLYSSGIFSSRDYKQDIERVGTHPLGIGLYRFRYRPAFRAKMGADWHQGVMADEVAQVLPAAVGRDADGLTVVDYSML
jgi:hypothetical protein